MRVIALTALVSLALVGCGQKTGPATPAPKPMTAAEKTAALAALPAPYNTADIANGQAKFGLCRSCHTVTPGGVNGVGPDLYGVFGRKAGTHEGFAYSDAVKGAGFTWDAEHLDKWLTSPRKFLPGTKMSFAGIKNDKDRADVIAYLRIAP